MKILWTALARRQRLEALEYLEERRTGWGRELNDSIDAAVDLVTEFPEAFPSIPGVDGEVRRAIVRGFRYWVIYEVVRDRNEAHVLALWHHSRKPFSAAR